MKVWRAWLIGLLFIGLALGGQGWAKVSGTCGNCHTMHNSQNGTDVVSGGPYRNLLKAQNCLGCHGETTALTAPFVKHNSDPGYAFDSTRGNTLAGGDFYYVGLGDAKVHNVDELGNADDVLTSPPGFDSTYASTASGGKRSITSWNLGTNPLTCSGTYGCHGDPQYADPFQSISGAHHSNVDRTGATAPTGVGDSFRFLLGIAGTEDPNYEANGTLSSSQHNGYYAVDRSSVNDPNTIDDTKSINALCAQCHGLFHYSVDYDTTVGSPWVRHPTDYDMNNVKTKEYGGYPNESLYTTVTGNGTYFPDVPVGNNQGAVLSTVLQQAGDAIVLCLSCHKAHGSPYDDLLRWDYSTCTAGAQDRNCGCFACHTTK